MDAHGDFLGQGWSFPIQPQGARILTVAGAADIKQAMLLILRTAPGERVMLPDFGCRLNELVFAAPNATTVSLVQLYVKQALDRWEPRVQLSGVEVEPSGKPRNCLLVTVDYLIRDRNRPDNLVYPFFLR